jgi:hypothetical protein
VAIHGRNCGASGRLFTWHNGRSRLPLPSAGCLCGCVFHWYFRLLSIRA